MRSKICQRNYWYNIFHITNLVDEPKDIVRCIYSQDFTEPICLLVSFSHMDVLGGVSITGDSVYSLLPEELQQVYCKNNQFGSGHCHDGVYSLQRLP